MSKYRKDASKDESLIDTKSLFYKKKFEISKSYTYTHVQTLSSKQDNLYSLKKDDTDKIPA